MTVLHRLGTRLSEYVSAVARSPPLFGLVVGVWLAVLTMFTATNPVTAFLVVAPATMILWYGVLYAAGRLRRQADEPNRFERSADGAASRTLGRSNGLFGLRGDDDPVDERPIQRLRTRYAEGDIDHAEFERRLEALVETEDLLDTESDEVATRQIERER
ncbi:SHOCT domain-containing protein [Halobellus captivus]|uniref:SHOCT domain-containing protein n=1 Tax=Halobellus captivus TaxID=2592614 RepID=UPI00193A5B2F|nr:SHOCT domain-containing protein [Halobellus captivus]